MKLFVAYDGHFHGSDIPVFGVGSNEGASRENTCGMDIALEKYNRGATARISISISIVLVAPSFAI